MRSRAIVAAALLLGGLVPATFATTSGGVAPQRQWAVVNFKHPTKVLTEILLGTYLIVHDEAKMARGEPCTSIYRVETPMGREQAAVSFHCIPRVRQVVGKFKITTAWDDALGMYAMTEYQFAGDMEGHGVPMATLALVQLYAPASRECAWHTGESDWITR